MQKSIKPGHPDVRLEIVHNSDLMALPEAVKKILESASRDEISIDSLSEIISRDPALTGRLLKIANSPFYGLSHKVNSVHQAVMVLGVTTVKCLAVSAAIFNPSRMRQDIGIDISALYGNIISVAITCRKLAVACKYSSPEDAFTCGLLHEIGLLYLLHHHPDEYRSVIGHARKSGSLHDEEVRAFGISHTETGKILVEKWRLPASISSAISNHHTSGVTETSRLDDILRLAVSLNRDFHVGPESCYIEDKIAKISVTAARLGIAHPQLDDIAASVAKEASAFARSTGIEIDDYEAVLARANRELFNTYMSVQQLFRERQELTRKILEEERARGLLEAKQVAISTLSHYINNATMAISGNSQVLKMSMKSKTPEQIVAMLPRILQVTDEAVQKIVAVLEEISELDLQENLAFYERSKILNIDDRIKERMSRLSDSHGLVLPQEAEIPSK